MVSSKATTVEAYLSSLPEDRRRSIEAVRKVVRRAMPAGFEEGMQYGMLGWYVPLSRYPNTYNGQPLALVNLASQKQHMSLYLACVYSDPRLAKRFEKQWKSTDKKLDMGKSCVRFKHVDDLALDAIVEAIGDKSVDEYIALYEAVQGSARLARAKKKAAKRRA